MFPGFQAKAHCYAGTEIFARIGGRGPPRVLLHGYPQTHAMWHKIVAELAPSSR